ncbi:MAG: sigma factor-like helix-turn-helix DNA-binding protein [Nanoarchaeota archaeon]|nr:sigma factor-like helix-turn-helix DNA-binding protein [Nanoarchaeota archaeon]
MQKNIENLLGNLLSVLNPKQKSVLGKRFGLQGKKETLQEIGNALNITRERVRQIENQGLEKIRKESRECLLEMTEIALRHLESVQGVREDEIFVREIQGLVEAEDAPNLGNKIRFFFFAAKEPIYSRETPSTKSFWYLNQNAKNRLEEAVEKILRVCATENKKKILEDKNFLAGITDLSEVNLLSISKKFAWNTFGDFGLALWPEISPRNIRDKAYLAVKKHGLPLHFEEIANVIYEKRVSARPVNIQTVHNELIKDKRFVLVGRGIYGLKEHGYEEGTVRDVIATLIRTHGPLEARRVVELVNEKRLLKENTILLNLQNRKYFKRLPNSAYDIREA